MFDIDAGHSPALRLGADKPRSVADEIADIDGQMATLCARRSELLLEIGSKVAQSEPIPVSTDNDFWSHRHRVMAGTAAKVARANGNVEALSAKNSEIARLIATVGFYPDRDAITSLLRAAASSEIRDPADALRPQDKS